MEKIKKYILSTSQGAFAYWLIKELFGNFIYDFITKLFAGWGSKVIVNSIYVLVILALSAICFYVIYKVVSKVFGIKINNIADWENLFKKHKKISISISIFFVFLIVMCYLKPWDKGEIKKQITQNKKLTLEDLFNREFNKLLKSTKEWEFTVIEDDTKFKIKSNVYYDFESMTKFISYYIPSHPKTFEICRDLTIHYKDVLNSSDGLVVESKVPGLRPVNSKDLKFTGIIYIYHEYPLFEKQKRDLYDLYEQNGLFVQFLDSEYLWDKNNPKENPIKIGIY